MKPRTESEIRGVILDAIHRIAPETDPQMINPDLPLRDQVDLDSMDSFNLLVGVSERLGIDIPESDYARFTTLRSCVAYLMTRVNAKAS